MRLFIFLFALTLLSQPVDAAGRIFSNEWRCQLDRVFGGQSNMTQSAFILLTSASHNTLQAENYFRATIINFNNEREREEILFPPNDDKARSYQSLESSFYEAMRMLGLSTIEDISPDLTFMVFMSKSDEVISSDGKRRIRSYTYGVPVAANADGLVLHYTCRVRSEIFDP